MSRLEEALRVRRQADCLHDEAALESAAAIRSIDLMATRIGQDYAGRTPLVLCVMNGGLYPTAEITRRLDLPFEQDYLHATRYRGATAGGGLVWKRQPEAQARQRAGEGPLHRSGLGERRVGARARRRHVGPPLASS